MFLKAELRQEFLYLTKDLRNKDRFKSHAWEAVKYAVESYASRWPAKSYGISRIMDLNGKTLLDLGYEEE